MTRVMANWEVESDIILPKDIPFVRYDHPGGAYSVFIRPSNGDGAARSVLTLQIIFDAPDLKGAIDLSEDLTKEFLDYLTYTSNMRARLGKLQHIFDWEPAADGSTMRHALYFHTVSGEDAPYEALEPPILDTIKVLQGKSISPRLRRALKWFANGVASQYQDDQFAFFLVRGRAHRANNQDGNASPGSMPAVPRSALLPSLQRHSHAPAVSQAGRGASIPALRQKRR